MRSVAEILNSWISGAWQDDFLPEIILLTESAMTTNYSALL